MVLLNDPNDFLQELHEIFLFRGVEERFGYGPVSQLLQAVDDDESWSNEYAQNSDIFCEDKIILFFLMSWATLINNTNSV